MAPRIDPGPPLWEQPRIPWPFGGGALALWLTSGAALLFGAGPLLVRAVDGDGWSGMALAMFGLMGLAAGLATALLALALGDRTQRVLSVLALVVGAALVGAIF